MQKFAKGVFFVQTFFQGCTYFVPRLGYPVIFLIVLGVANQEAHGCSFNCKKQDVESATDQNDLEIQNSAKDHIPKDLNKTTSRFIRNNYMCQIGITQASVRPRPTIKNTQLCSLVLLI